MVEITDRVSVSVAFDLERTTSYYRLELTHRSQNERHIEVVRRKPLSWWHPGTNKKFDIVGMVVSLASRPGE